jgi:hypothetical protein
MGPTKVKMKATESYFFLCSANIIICIEPTRALIRPGKNTLIVNLIWFKILFFNEIFWITSEKLVVKLALEFR